MQRPTQNGLAGIASIFLLAGMLNFFLEVPAVKRTLVLYCNRHHTNNVSVKPEIPKWKSVQIGGTKHLVPDTCVLEGQFPKQESGPLPVQVAMMNCSSPPSPMQLGIWKKVKPNDNVEVYGWDKKHRPCTWHIGYLYQEYRLAIK
jgi:hypothetical protein